jgi:RNA polymerase sigma-70 factor (ECF subfamily)
MATRLKTEDGCRTVATSSDPQNFTELFHLYKNRTYDFALRMLGDDQAAGDVTQEVFLRLYQHQSNHSRIADVKSWLFIVARNLCLNQLRDRSRHQPLDSAEKHPAPADSAVDPRQRALRRALAALEPEYREVIILKMYQGFTYREIAGILGKTVPAIRSLLFQARSRLRDRIDKL